MSASSSEARSRLLTALWPALAVGCGYVFLSGRPQMLKLRKAKERHASVVKDAPRAPEVQSLALQERALREQVQALEQRVAALETADRGEATGALAEVVQVEDLSELLRRHGLILLRSSMVAEPTRVVGPRRRTIVESPSRLREIAFEGAYADVHAALDELSRSALSVQPLALSLSPGPGPGRWTLLVWI